jgi:hypothetical protein
MACFEVVFRYMLRRTEKTSDEHVTTADVNPACSQYEAETPSLRYSRQVYPATVERACCHIVYVWVPAELLQLLRLGTCGQVCASVYDSYTRN